MSVFPFVLSVLCCCSRVPKTGWFIRKSCRFGLTITEAEKAAASAWLQMSSTYCSMHVRKNRHMCKKETKRASRGSQTGSWTCSIVNTLHEHLCEGCASYNPHTTSQTCCIWNTDSTLVLSGTIHAATITPLTSNIHAIVSFLLLLSASVTSRMDKL